MPRESFSPEGRCRLCSEAVCVNFTVLPYESSFIPLISKFLGGAERKGCSPVSNVCPIHPRCFLDNCSLSTYVRDSFIPHVKLLTGVLCVCECVCVCPALCRDNYAAQKPWHWSLQMLQPQDSP